MNICYVVGGTYSKSTPSRLYFNAKSITVLTNAVLFSADPTLVEKYCEPVHPPIDMKALTPYGATHSGAFFEPCLATWKLTFLWAVSTNLSKSGLDPIKLSVWTLGVVSLLAKKSFSVVSSNTTRLEIIIYAKAYVRWVYFDQLTFDRGNPVVECHPAYQAEATLDAVLSTLRIARTRMGSTRNGNPSIRYQCCWKSLNTRTDAYLYDLLSDPVLLLGCLHYHLV